MEQGFVALFERKVLFRIARFVAFSICFLLFLALLGGGLYLLTSGRQDVSRPNPAEVAESLKPVEASAEGDAAAPDAAGESAPLNASVLKGLKVPPVLQELLLDPRNQRIFKDWLDAMPEEERQAFIDGLAEAVTKGRAAGLEDAEVVNAYHAEFAKYVIEKKQAEELAKAQRVYVAGALVSILMLLALFSLVLVLLAIERNTRPDARAGTA